MKYNKLGTNIAQKQILKYQLKVDILYSIPF